MDIKNFFSDIKAEKIMENLHDKKEIDFSLEIFHTRFRVNLFKWKNKLGLVLRKINLKIKTVKELELPENILSLCREKSGIVIVTGPTGSGKSTTLAALIDYINKNQKKHIITIEDPIEYIFSNDLSLITQREVGRDSIDFSSALRYSLRQDPDVIMVGEIRDKETLEVAMRAAETGHLCFCTLHTLGAANTICRIIDFFNLSEREQVLNTLFIILKGIISQQLIKCHNVRKPVIEMLFVDKAIANLIKEGKINQIGNQILINKKRGMISMDSQLIELYNQNKIDIDNLRECCIDVEYIEKNLKDRCFGNRKTLYRI